MPVPFSFLLRNWVRFCLEVVCCFCVITKPRVFSSVKFTAGVRVRGMGAKTSMKKRIVYAVFVFCFSAGVGEVGNAGGVMSGLSVKFCL